MKFICSLICVEDISRSRKLYEQILGQKVIGDFGEYNVAFEGGLALYKRSLYQSLIGDDRTILNSPNNFELYFEDDHLVEIEREIAENGFEFIHKIREEPWKQQAFRFYDADQNAVVIAERMEITTSRLYELGHSVQEITTMTGMPVEEIKQLLGELLVEKGE